MAMKNMQDLEDWFVVSKLAPTSNSEELAKIIYFTLLKI